MNWRRGLFRLWIVLSLPWFGVSGYLNQDTIGTAYETLTTAEEDNFAPQDCAVLTGDPRTICELQNRLGAQAARARERAFGDLWGAGLWTLGPPAVLALAMVVLGWVARGFRPR